MNKSDMRIFFSQIVELTRDLEGLNEDDSYDEIVMLNKKREAVFNQMADSVIQRFALYDKVAKKAIHVVNSADSTGCSGDVTVVSLSDVNRLAHAIAALGE